MSVQLSSLLLLAYLLRCHFIIGGGARLLHGMHERFQPLAGEVIDVMDQVTDQVGGNYCTRTHYVRNAQKKTSCPYT